MLALEVYEVDDEGNCVLPDEAASTDRSDSTMRVALNCRGDAIETTEY